MSLKNQNTESKLFDIPSGHVSRQWDFIIRLVNIPHFKGDEIQTVNLGDFLITAQAGNSELNFLSLISKCSSSVHCITHFMPSMELRAPGELTVYCGDSNGLKPWSTVACPRLYTLCFIVPSASGAQSKVGLALKYLRFLNKARGRMHPKEGEERT